MFSPSSNVQGFSVTYYPMHSILYEVNRVIDWFEVLSTKSDGCATTSQLQFQMQSDSIQANKVALTCQGLCGNEEKQDLIIFLIR